MGLLVKHDYVPKMFELENVSIEDIMVNMIKGKRMKALLYKDIVTVKKALILSLCY